MHTIAEGLALAPADAHASVLVAQGTYAEMTLTPTRTTQLVGGYQSGGAAWDPALYVTTIAAPVQRSANLLVLSADSVRAEGFTLTGVSRGSAVINITGRATTLRTLTLTKNRIGMGEPVIAINAPADGVLFDRCIIARNLAGALTTGRGMVGIGAGANASFEDCTFTLDSTKTTGGTPGLYVEGAVTVRNTILSGLRPMTSAPIVLVGSGTADVTYSDVQGGWPGTGNIAADPLFCGAKAGNFTLSALSPCVGAGQDSTTIGALDVGCAKPSNDDETASVVARPEIESTVSGVTLDVHPTLVHGDAEIRFALPQESHVTVEVFDATGVRVRTLVSNALPAGRHVATWRTSERTIASGVYVVQLSTNGSTLTRDVLVLR